MQLQWDLGDITVINLNKYAFCSWLLIKSNCAENELTEQRSRCSYGKRNIDTFFLRDSLRNRGMECVEEYVSHIHKIYSHNVHSIYQLFQIATTSHMQLHNIKIYSVKQSEYRFTVMGCLSTSFSIRVLASIFSRSNVKYLRATLSHLQLKHVNLRIQTWRTKVI